MIVVLIFEDYQLRYWEMGTPIPPWVELLPFGIPAYGLLTLLGYFLMQGLFLRGCRYGSG